MSSLFLIETRRGKITRSMVELPILPGTEVQRGDILTIGGSTTECVYLSDGKTWTDRFAQRLAAVRPDSWVNNAGLDGQSTYGHLVLLRNFVFSLHPSTTIDPGRDPGRRQAAGSRKKARAQVGGDLGPRSAPLTEA